MIKVQKNLSELFRRNQLKARVCVWIKPDFRSIKKLEIKGNGKRVQITQATIFLLLKLFGEAHE